MRDWRGLGCAVLLGASIAFPLGMLVGGNEPAGEISSQSAPPDRSQAPVARDVYSPRVIGDPYVIEQQRRVLEALELDCLRSRRHCAEAEQARRRIAEAEARR